MNVWLMFRIIYYAPSIVHDLLSPVNCFYSQAAEFGYPNMPCKNFHVICENILDRNINQLIIGTEMPETFANSRNGHIFP
jgi:hypothetical protein